MNRTVHRWPIIVLTIGDGEVIADTNGDILTYPLPDPSAFSAVAAAAATEACRRLGLKACRVQGHDGSGGVFEMIIDAETGALEERPVESVSELSSGRSKGITAGGSSGPKRRGRKWAAWGSVTVLAVAVGGSVAYSSQRATEVPAAVIYTPPPAQLPVPAPVGWDTYASWSTPMTGSSVRSVLDPAGNPISVEDSLLTAHDPETGIEEWTRIAPFKVTGIAVFEYGDKALIAAAAARDLVLFGDSAEPISVEVPQNGTIVLDGGTVPRVDLPERRSLLISADGQASSRVVPAAAEPVEALGQDLVAADIKAGKVWRIGSDSAALPSPAVVPPPSAEASLIGIVGSMDGRITAAWKQGEKAFIVFYDLGSSTQTTSLSQVGFIELEGSEVPLSGLQSDRKNSLFLAGPVLIDVENMDAHRLAGNGKLSAGYVWTSGSGQQSRINRQGEVEATSRTSRAAVPDVITANGLAVTRVEGSSTGLLYALSKRSPLPSITPSPSLKETNK